MVVLAIPGILNHSQSRFNVNMAEKVTIKKFQKSKFKSHYAICCTEMCTLYHALPCPRRRKAGAHTDLRILVIYAFVVAALNADTLL